MTTELTTLLVAEEFVSDPEYRAKLREPFPSEQIGKLPRVTCKACINKGCQQHEKKKCPTCKAFVSTAHMHIDYVGHAAVTDRLNKVAPDAVWTIEERFMWETKCWIYGTLTIGGITRPEFGDGDDPKEAVGNFIRRAAMRFGVGLDLWSKEELESASVEPAPVQGHATQKSEGGRKADADEGTSAYGEGARSPVGDGGVPTPPSDERILTSQVHALQRAAGDLRWTDADIAAALREAGLGDGGLNTLTQVQARKLIPEWQALVKASRMNPEQIDYVKTLVTLKDAKTVAEILFGFKVSSLLYLTVSEGDTLISELTKRKEEGWTPQPSLESS